MSVTTIKSELQRKATIFTTGGFRPTSRLDESWIGKVVAYELDESLPMDASGMPMQPLAQFGIQAMPFIPPVFRDTALVTVFVSVGRLPAPYAQMGDHFVIREYQSLDHLVAKELTVVGSVLKPFPLQPQLVEEDYPNWDDPIIPLARIDEIMALEEDGAIDSYYDFATNAFGHKFGGYPSFCQCGVPFSDGFEFVFQISSDEKANFNVVSGGSLMFAKHSVLGTWEVYYDFF